MAASVVVVLVSSLASSSSSIAIFRRRRLKRSHPEKRGVSLFGKETIDLFCVRSSQHMIDGRTKVVTLPEGVVYVSSKRQSSHMLLEKVMALTPFLSLTLLLVTT